VRLLIATSPYCRQDMQCRIGNAVDEVSLSRWSPGQPFRGFMFDALSWLRLTGSTFSCCWHVPFCRCSVLPVAGVAMTVAEAATVVVAAPWQLSRVDAAGDHGSRAVPFSGRGGRDPATPPIHLPVCRQSHGKPVRRTLELWPGS
jgi:hypothetical protein